MNRKDSNVIIDIILALYILSLYVFTYRTGYNKISNILAVLLIATIWADTVFKNKKIIFNKLLLCNFIFIMICMGSVLYAVDQKISYSKVKTLFLIFVVMISLVNYLDTDKKVVNITKYFSFSGFLLSMYIFIISDFSVITRFGSSIGNVNAIGMNIGIAAIFTIYLFLSKRKFIYLLFLVIMLSTILLTGSRKALILTVSNLIIITFLSSKKNIVGIAKFVLFIICVFIICYNIIFNIPIFNEIIGIRIKNFISFVLEGGSDEASINVRYFMIEYGVEKFMNRPFTGYGIDNFRVFDFGTYSHNNYIEIMVDTGMLGFGTYYLTHIVLLKDLFNSLRFTKDKLLSYTMISIVFTYLLLGFAMVYYDSKHFSFLIAIGSVIHGTSILNKNIKDRGD